MTPPHPAMLASLRQLAARQLADVASAVNTATQVASAAAAGNTAASSAAGAANSVTGAANSVSSGISEVNSVRNTFSSWDNCMAKGYCKWPAIIGIVVGSLIVISIIWCCARCLCCGMSCCCSCLSCCDCFKPRGRGEKPKRKDYADVPGSAGGGTVNNYYNHPPPAYGNVNAFSSQTATFDAPSRNQAHNEDSLPHMPSWQNAQTRKVEDTTPQHEEEHELAKMDGLLNDRRSSGYGYGHGNGYGHDQQTGIIGGAAASGAGAGTGAVAAVGGRTGRGGYAPVGAHQQPLSPGWDQSHPPNQNPYDSAYRNSYSANTNYNDSGDLGSQRSHQDTSYGGAGAAAGYFNPASHHETSAPLSQSYDNRPAPPGHFPSYATTVPSPGARGYGRGPAPYSPVESTRYEPSVNSLPSYHTNPRGPMSPTSPQSTGVAHDDTRPPSLLMVGRKPVPGSGRVV